MHSHTAEDFAQKRLEAENLIRQYAPAPLQEQLVALLRPAIALTATRADDAQVPIGASKFGGVPDVPEEFEWPMRNETVPLIFLCQINLEEISSSDVLNEFPHRGILSFFYGIQDGPSEDICRTYWFEDERLQRFLFPPTTPDFKTCCVDFSTYLECADLFEYMSWEDFQAILEHKVLPITDTSSASLLKLIGFPDAVYGFPQFYIGDETPILNSTDSEYQLLLQVDSYKVPDMNWGDCGVLYFFIRKDDFANHEFTRIQVAMTQA